MKTAILGSICLGSLLGALTRAAQEIIPEPSTLTGAYYSAAGLAIAVLLWTLAAHCRKVGGLTFFRLGRVCLSWCRTHA